MQTFNIDANLATSIARDLATNTSDRAELIRLAQLVEEDANPDAYAYCRVTTFTGGSLRLRIAKPTN